MKPRTTFEGPEDLVGEEISGTGSRGALCELIGRSVTSITIDEREMRLTAGNGCVLSLRLDDEEGEAMHFVPGLGKGVQVW